MKKMRALWIAGGVLVAAGATALELPVKLTVHENAGVARAKEPVSGGVPMPQGLVKDLSKLVLVNAEGKEVPAQFSAINHWASDGSVMWLLVQSRATVSANGRTTFELRNGEPKARSDPLNVSEDESAIAVDTGTIKFSVNKESFNLIDEAWLDADADGTYAESEQVIASRPYGGSDFVLKAEKGTYVSTEPPPARVVIEEQGSERVVVLIEGRHGSGEGDGYLPYCYGYMVRIRAYAGKPYVRISYTLTNHHLPTIGSPVCAEATIAIPLNIIDDTEATLGGETSRASGKVSFGKGVSVLCEGTGGNIRTGHGYTIATKTSGLNADALSGRLGWAAVSDGRFGASFSVRYLRENHPVALRVESEENATWFQLYFWPDEIKEGHYLDIYSHKTYEMQLAFAPGRKAVENAAEIFKAYDNALRFWPPQEWTAATKAWGDFGGLVYPKDERALQQLKKARPYEATGWRLHGSTPEMASGSSGAPGGGYEPLITDIVFYNGYMQTGFRHLYDQLERTSWFWRDRRLIHREDDVSTARWEGSGTYSQLSKKALKAYPDVQIPDYGKRFGHGPWSYGGWWGPMDTQHFSVDEVVSYYYLTGDRQCLMALNKYAEQAASLAIRSMASVRKSGSSRAHGWTTRALMTVYEATGEARWLKLSKEMVSAILEGQDKTAGTISPVHPAPRRGKPGTHTPFMAAVVGMALGRYYRHHPEEEVLDGILGLADWLCYDVVKEAGGFSYHWSPADPGGRSLSGHRCMNTMSWAYRATGQKRYLDAADKHAAGWRLGQWYLSGFGQDYLTIKQGKREDSVLPGTVTDLSAKATGEGAVSLSWSAPGDDDTKGRAAKYQVKYARLPIKERSDWRNAPDKEISFWAAVNCKDEPAPATPGTRESLDVKDLEPGTYWFALKTYDEQPNQSDLSNVVRADVK